MRERRIEGVHRAVALGHRHDLLAVDLEPRRRFGERDQFAFRIPPPLVEDAEAVQPEEFGDAFENAADQKLETRLGAVIGIAFEFAGFDQIDQRLDLRIVSIDGKTHLPEARHDIRAAGLIGHHHVTAVADHFRRDVLVAARILFDRRNMQPALVGEGGFADIGRVVLRDAIESLVQQAARHGSGASSRRG